MPQQDQKSKSVSIRLFNLFFSICLNFEGIFLSIITPIFFVSGHKVLILFGNKLIEFSPINIEYFTTATLLCPRTPTLPRG